MVREFSGGNAATAPGGIQVELVSDRAWCQMPQHPSSRASFCIGVHPDDPEEHCSLLHSAERQRTSSDGLRPLRLAPLLTAILGSLCCAFAALRWQLAARPLAKQGTAIQSTAIAGKYFMPSMCTMKVDMDVGCVGGETCGEGGALTGSPNHTIHVPAAIDCAAVCAQEDLCTAAQWVNGSCAMLSMRSIDHLVDAANSNGTLWSCFKSGALTKALDHIEEGSRLGWATIAGPLATLKSKMEQKVDEQLQENFGWSPEASSTDYPLRQVMYLTLKRCVARGEHMRQMLRRRAKGIKAEAVEGVELTKGIDAQPEDVKDFMHFKGVGPEDLEGNVTHWSDFQPIQMRTVPVAVEWSIYFAHARIFKRIAELVNTSELDPIDGVLVLEDDAVLDKDWLAVYNNSTQHLSDDWEVLKLYWELPFPTLFSMAAYVVRAGAAASILSKVMAAPATHNVFTHFTRFEILDRNIDVMLPMAHVDMSVAWKSCASTEEGLPCT